MIKEQTNTIMNGPNVILSNPRRLTEFIICVKVFQLFYTISFAEIIEDRSKGMWTTKFITEDGEELNYHWYELLYSELPPIVDILWTYISGTFQWDTIKEFNAMLPGDAISAVIEALYDWKGDSDPDVDYSHHGEGIIYIAKLIEIGDYILTTSTIKKLPPMPNDLTSLMEYIDVQYKNMDIDEEKEINTKKDEVVLDSESEIVSGTESVYIPNGKDFSVSKQDEIMALGMGVTSEKEESPPEDKEDIPIINIVKAEKKEEEENEEISLTPALKIIERNLEEVGIFRTNIE